MKLSLPTAATVEMEEGAGRRGDTADVRLGPTSARSMLWGYDTQVFPTSRSIRCVS